MSYSFPRQQFGLGGLRVDSFKCTYNLKEVELWGHWVILKTLKYSPADNPVPKQN